MQKTNAKLIFTLVSVVSAVLLTACGTTITPINQNSPTIPGPSFPPIPNNPLPTPTPTPTATPGQFAFNPAAFGDYSGITSNYYTELAQPPTALPPNIYFDEEYLGVGVNPWNYFYNAYPILLPLETRALATIGNYKLTLALQQASYGYGITYEVTLPASVVPLSDAGCGDMSGLYSGPVNLCIRFTQASMTPFTLTAKFTGNGVTLTKILRVFVLPQGLSPNLELTALPTKASKTFWVGVRDAGDRIVASNSPGSFRLQSTYNGRKLTNVTVSPAVTSFTEIGSEWVASVASPGRYTVSALYQNSLGQTVPVTKEILIPGFYNFQMGEADGDNLSSSHRGIVTCTNSTGTAEELDLAYVDGSTTYHQELNVPANGTDISTPVKRKSFSSNYIYGTLLVPASYTQGLICVMDIYKDDQNFSLANRVATWEIK